jgi:hypothetical protein
LVAPAGELDLCAVHVHFTVADIVEPRPRKNCASIFDFRWNLEGEILLDTVGAGDGSGTTARMSAWAVQVQEGVGRAASNPGVNDLPVVGILLLGLIGLIRNGDLARATTMDSPVGAITKCELKRLG